MHQQFALRRRQIVGFILGERPQKHSRICVRVQPINHSRAAALAATGQTRLAFLSPPVPLMTFPIFGSAASMAASCSRSSSLINRADLLKKTGVSTTVFSGLVTRHIYAI